LIQRRLWSISVVAALLRSFHAAFRPLTNVGNCRVALAHLMSPRGCQAGVMNINIFNAMSNASEVELSAAPIVASGAGLLAITAITLAALEHAWDYSIAVQLGCALGILLAWLCWRELPAERLGDRAVVLLAGALSAVLLCVFLFAGIDRAVLLSGAFAGAAAGLVLFVVFPARFVLRHARAIPNGAGLMLFALALMPMALWLMEWSFGDAELAGSDPVVLGACRATMLVAALGFVFAVRWRMRSSAWAMLSVVAFFGIVPWLGENLSAAVLNAGAVAAGAGFLLMLPRSRGLGATHATLRFGSHATRVATTLGVAFLICSDPGTVALVASSTLLLLRAPEPCSEAAGPSEAVAPVPPFLPPVGMTAALFGLAAVLCAWLCVSVFLVQAAVLNWTGPVVLAELRERAVWTVPPATFARAMMRDQYLWRDEQAGTEPAGSSPAAVIDALRHERDQWSYSEPIEAALQDGASEAMDYGIEVGYLPGERGRVRYVFDGSPAHVAGVRRGDTIVAAARTNNATRFKLVAPGGAAREVAVAKATYPTPAVVAEKLLRVDGRKVGYVALRHFQGSAAWEFESAVRRLSGADVGELVLDLRMNGGGWLDHAARVGGMIAGERVAGRPFLKTLHNSRYRNRDRIHPFPPAEHGLSLPRVFVITAADTCSASEALIRGVSPYIEVITVGGKTCGKPVGSLPLVYGDEVYTVIGFKALNARGEGDFYGGLTPTCAAADDLTRELGDPKEASLAAALHYIRFGRCPGRG
jgi:carboxyl-terminal processing protease